MLKRMLCMMLLLSVGLAACGRQAETPVDSGAPGATVPMASPATGTAADGSEAAAPAVEAASPAPATDVAAPAPTTEAAPSDAAPEQTGPVDPGPRETDEPARPDDPAPTELSPALAAAWPAFAPLDSPVPGMLCEHVADGDVDAYAAELEAAGLEVWRSADQLFVSQDRWMLLLNRADWAEHTWVLSWREAAPDTPIPDLEAVRAMLPAGRLLSLVDLGPVGLAEATGLHRYLAAVESQADDPWFSALGTPLVSDEAALICRTFELLTGPAGCAALQGYYGSGAGDPLWADLDGDGENEFVYWTYGPTSGLFTVALWAYGLEQGFPVVKGHTILNLTWGDVGLEQQEDGIFLRYAERRYNRETGDSDAQPEVLIPLVLRDGRILARDGDWPTGIQSWGGTGFGLLGSSFAAARQFLKDELLLDRPSCLIWRVTYDTADSDVPPETCVAFTTNGISVTGLACFREAEDGTFSGWCKGAKLIPAPEDPESLVGFTERQLAERLGPCHFREDRPNNPILYYLTEDAKLLSICMADAAVSATLSLPLTELLSTEDTVFVSSDVPSTVQNRDRWDDFLARTGRGEPDELLLQIGYPGGIFALKLRYDGELYHLEDGDRETTFSCLLVSEETDPPARASYRSATHYLLSDDPEMTYDRCFSHMVSSAWDPDFPPTRPLFSLYRD